MILGASGLNSFLGYSVLRHSSCTLTESHRWPCLCLLWFYCSSFLITLYLGNTPLSGEHGPGLLWESMTLFQTHSTFSGEPHGNAALCWLTAYLPGPSWYLLPSSRYWQPLCSHKPQKGHTISQLGSTSIFTVSLLSHLNSFPLQREKKQNVLRETPDLLNTHDGWLWWGQDG